ncbi:MAG: MvaI/BcnI family restriction endonuclease [Sulfuriferula sp.]
MFADLDGLLRRFSELGAIRAFCKPLAENDNSKQQIYLGSKLEVVQMFPFEAVETTAKGKDSTYKAKLNFSWVSSDRTEQAAWAQLILYPQYPEVRLSGFLRGCKLAPSEQLQPIPAQQRRFNNGSDGRIMFFGITRNGETLAYLAAAESAIAREFRQRQAEGVFSQENIFFNLPLLGRESKLILLEKLAVIRDGGWQPSISLKGAGILVPCNASQCGGYTLEALLGVIRNSKSEPDFMGWEIKAYSRDKVTLITPEPNGGMYGEEGVKAFVHKYGKPSKNDTLYFTGTHRADCRNAKTGLTLAVRGFNPVRNVIEDVDGAVELLTDAGRCAAAWSFDALLIKWNKKHAQAAYIPYKRAKEPSLTYRYFSPALLGEGTDFNRYLAALCAGRVIFDPGSKVMNASTAKSTVKARSQFRMSVRNLAGLYQKFGPVEF